MKNLRWPGASLLLCVVFVESTRGEGPDYIDARNVGLDF
jgi:hypothetical protein